MTIDSLMMGRSMLSKNTRVKRPSNPNTLLKMPSSLMNNLFDLGMCLWYCGPLVVVLIIF